METKNFDELKGNPKNPRQISTHDFNALKKSMREFGDLSGIVFNVRTQRLVGGHMRTESFKALQGQKKIIIAHRFDQPNQVGTIAIGYVDWNNEQFGYREVDWDEARELTANVAANRIQGQFDLDLLAEVNLSIKNMNPDLLELTGQTEDEVNRLLQLSSEPESEADESEDTQHLSFVLPNDQADVVNEALGYAKARMTSAEVRTLRDTNGKALYLLCKDFLGRLHEANEHVTPAQK